MARRRLGALAAIGVARAAAAAASARFPEYALDLDTRLGFPDVDAVALRRKNRRRVDALKKFEPKVCDATVPYPPHQRRPLHYVHVPKAGTPFLTTVARYACLNATARVPAYGDPLPSGGACGGPRKRRKRRAGDKYDSPCVARGREVVAAFYDRCKGVKAWYYGDVPQQMDRADLHQPFRRDPLARGAAYVTMVRAPDQRLASAYAFGRHVGFGMPKTYRNLLLEASEDTFERYAKFPFVRGCATKMLSSVACAGPPRPVDVRSPLCYPTPANWSALCPDVGPRGACDATTDCAGPNAAQIRIAAENLERFAFAGITELWDLSLCLFHRLHGGARTRGDGRVSNRQGGRGAGAGKYAATALVDVADEILFSHVLDRFEREVRCVVGRMPRGATEACAVALAPYRPPNGVRAVQEGLARAPA